MPVGLHLETTPYTGPLVNFINEYGLMIVGAFLLLSSFQGRRFGPLALIPLVLGLGLFMAGPANLVVPLVGR